MKTVKIDEKIDVLFFERPVSDLKRYAFKIAKFLKEIDPNCTANEMFDVIGSLLPQQRTRYGTGYSKTDFSVLDKTYEDYKGGKM